MEQTPQTYTIFDAVTPVAVSSSTDATPIVITTSTNHGYSTGDQVLIYGHTTNIAANGIYQITVLSNTTFSLQDKVTGEDIAGSGAGAGSSGLVVESPRILDVRDFRHLVFYVSTGGTATLTLSFAGSAGNVSYTPPQSDTPNFGGTQSSSNLWDFIEVVDLEDGTAIDGDTGVATTGADFQTGYETNTNAIKYATVFPTDWTQGSITIKAIVSNNT